ncbi:hypothetical protein CPB84DRAFT_558426 [Gymnopilus junonius]|uniref:Uncharacterized protein n=1 Tax=Gymnopilus junonius TaxID=109634 RepID=A0A9P5TGZ2_GYMJU|nr:hypothetical protein CPB84DRAFT_558426 [Gymnopilus junonius]
MPGVKLTHSSSDSVDVEGKPTTADASLLGAPQPSAYPPLQHGSYGQPQPTYSAESYSTNPSVQYSKSRQGMQPSTQLNQTVFYSQRPPNSVAQNYTPSMTPAVAQV